MTFVGRHWELRGTGDDKSVKTSPAVGIAIAGRRMLDSARSVRKRRRHKTPYGFREAPLAGAAAAAARGFIQIP